jgi:hypothetical protein
VPINYTQLATEINTDPKALGYAGKSDYAISVILNTPGASAETIFKAFTETAEIVAGIVRAEYDVLTAANKAFLTDVILKAPRIKTGDANLRAGIGNIFAAGTASRTALVAAASKSATRGEVLFGEGTSIGDADVAKALGRG